MQVVTAQRMAMAETLAIQNGIAEEALIESAGRHVADTVHNVLRQHAGRRVVILCGPGKNGVDGFVAARYLHNRGYAVTYVLTHPIQSCHALGQPLHKVLLAMGVSSIDLSEENEDVWQQCVVALSECDVLVDALIGLGLNGPLRGNIARLVQHVHSNAADKFSVAVDIPTGVYSDSAHVTSHALSADVTVVMTTVQPGHLLLPGHNHCGRLEICDVGVPSIFIDNVSHMAWCSMSEVAKRFPERPVDAHKGTFGHVLCVSGSVAMPGAATLALQACLRSGAGLCSWSGPQSLHAIIAGYSPDVMLYPLPEEDGYVREDGVPFVLHQMQKCDVLAIGPGLGRNDQVRQFVRSVLQSVHAPIVADADALYHLAHLGHWPHDEATVRIVTPHPKELARLIDTDVKAVLNNRVDAARQAARQYGAVVVSKGYPTLVAQPDGYVVVCHAGNPVLSVGGSGDVLTGLIAGLLAQGISAADAALVAVHWHGFAADRLARHGRNAGYTASELVEELVHARAHMRRIDATEVHDGGSLSSGAS